MAELTITRRRNMNTIEEQRRDAAADASAAEARHRRVTAVAWLAGVTAVIALLGVSSDASFGTGLAVIGVCGMVAAVSWMILREK